MADLTQILADRGSRYGDFLGHATVTQRLKKTIMEELTARGRALHADQQEAVDMICHKLGRIINGDPDYADSWDDIAGYAKLVGDRLNSQFGNVAALTQTLQTLAAATQEPTT